MATCLLRHSLLGAVLTISAAQARAQCQPSWIPTFGEAPGVDGAVNAMKVFNDGGGAALYVGGGFTHAGGVLAPFVAKWETANWSALPGINGIVSALTVFDDGSGRALYAGGSFGVAKWNGTTWTYLANGPNGTVLALAEFDDGQGTQLYAGGTFTNAGGAPARGIAKWSGSAWSPVGTGQPPGVGGVGARVLALAVFDDGNGDVLFVGGDFNSAGAIGIHNCIAKWDGLSWAALGSGTNSAVRSLAVFDDGGGRALHAGGNFTTAGGLPVDHIAKWNGSSWSALASGPDGNIHVLADFNDGSGRALYAGGLFTHAGGVVTNNVAKWNGSSWSNVGAGSDSSVNSLAAFNDGSGAGLYAGGDFRQMGGFAAKGVAKWNGSMWSALGSGMNDYVRTLTNFDDGSGPALYAGGHFLNPSSVSARYVAKWNGSKWFGLGSGMDNWVLALAVFDDGSGPVLCAGGSFTLAGGVTVNGIAKWDGSAWSALGGGVTASAYPTIRALTVFDDGSGPALYVGGAFTSAGAAAASNIARWNGSSWSALGSGTNGIVLALEVFDDGSGATLFAAGQFTTAGGISVKNIATWNGTSWTPVASTMTSNSTSTVAQCLSVFDDGSGAALFVGGLFTVVDGVPANTVAKWDGLSWTALGSGLEGVPSLPVAGDAFAYALTAFDDGSGSALHATGNFGIAGGAPATNIAKWNGSSWSRLGSGLDAPLGFALAEFDDSSGLALYVGGGFMSALDSHDSYLAKWGCPFVSAGTSYCTPGTTSNGCVPTISGVGNASATNGSGFTIAVSSLESHRLGVVFYGIHGQLAFPWGAGGTSLLCVKAPTQRLDPYDSGGSPGLCNGLISEDWNLFITNHPSALGQPFLGGETVWAQGWFRDPLSAKTTGLSNGVVFAVAP